MKGKINVNAVNQFSKGTDIYTQGEAVQSITLILKGRILVHNKGAKFLVNSGTFLGVNDLYEGSYLNTYTAQDDVVAYIFAVNHKEELEQILSMNNDYHGFMVASLNRMIHELHKIYQGMIKLGSGLYQFLTDQYQDYIDSASRCGYKAVTSETLKTLCMLESDLELEKDRINYYIECTKLPIDVVKSYYSYGNFITMYQLEDQADIINQQVSSLTELSDKLTKMAECLVGNRRDCLFELITEASGNNPAAMDIMDNIIDEINQVENFYDHMLGRKLAVDRKKMEEAYHQILTGTKGNYSDNQVNGKYSKEDMEKVIGELDNSYDKLLEYAGFPSDQSENMKEAMRNFVNLKDRLSTDDSVRIIRRQLTENHYLMYREIFLKAIKDQETPRTVDLFLKYGYADERLLTKEQLISLYFLKEEKEESMISVYNIKEWLTLIYEGKKEPSKNEFDLEYSEYLVSLRKQGKLTEKEVTEWSNSPENKLDYEIQNMFRYNNKTTNGQISTFVPVLHKEMVNNLFDKVLLSPSKISNVFNEILRIDFSIFNREVIYSQKNIVKEYIIKQVFPDIILMPTAGENGIMWQEITGKKRDSSGRFMLPIFCETSLNAIMIRLFGRFRWEMCRSIEGTAWNDIKHKSLTSEYCDYLQFYRKNRELSEEKKEKLKLQIQRGRNSREIFVIDYEHWINYEAMGAIKLNKPVREMMATYCPFSKEIRERLKLQPIFEEAMARYHKDKLKKIRDIEARYRLLQKDQIELTKELTDTLNYYKEM